IPGANGPCLVFPSVSLSDVGNYCVKATGPYNSVTNCARLTVQTTVTTSTVLIDVMRCIGESAAFRTDASGPGPYTYVWRRDRQLIPNQANSSLNLDSVSLADAGLYCVEVSGPCNSVTNCATLMVNNGATALISLTNCPGTTAS